MDKSPWISGRRAAAMIPMDGNTFRRIAMLPENGIRRMEIPGCRVKFHADDVARLVGNALKVPEKRLSFAVPGDGPGVVRIAPSAQAVASA